MGRGTASLAGAVLGAALAGAGGPQARLYGADNIARYIRKHGRSWQVGHSVAGLPHEHKREIARRLRQAERNRERREERVALAQVKTPAGFGLSRRGRVVAL